MACGWHADTNPNTDYTLINGSESLPDTHDSAVEVSELPTCMSAASNSLLVSFKYVLFLINCNAATVIDEHEFESKML